MFGMKPRVEMYERRLVRRYGRVEQEEDDDIMLYVTGGNGLLGRERSMMSGLVVAVSVGGSDE